MRVRFAKYRDRGAPQQEASRRQRQPGRSKWAAGERRMLCQGGAKSAPTDKHPSERKAANRRRIITRQLFSVSYHVPGIQDRADLEIAHCDPEPLGSRVDDLPVAHVDRHVADAFFVRRRVKHEVAGAELLQVHMLAFPALGPGIPRQRDAVLSEDLLGEGGAVDAFCKGGAAKDVLAAVILQRGIDDVPADLGGAAGVGKQDRFLGQVDDLAAGSLDV